jgi:tetratricopeptide (TPR) repeat protein
MSPEQMTGQTRLDGRTDLYALAAIAYEMIAGHPPVAADSGESLLRQKLLAAPTSLQIIRAAVPTALDSAILRGLAATAADRQATVGEFVRECVEAMRTPDREPALGTPTPARFSLSPGSVVPAPKLAPSRLAWVSRAVLVALGAFLVWTLAARRKSDSTVVLPEGQRAWFVIADVETTPPDEGTAAAARSILVSRFEQSAMLGVLTGEEVSGVLRSAGKPESSTVTLAVAREIAVRARAKGVLAASFRRSTDGSVLTLRAIDVDRDSVVVSISERAASKSLVLPAFEKAVARLQEALMPQAAVMSSVKNRGSTEATAVVTADFEAFRFLVRAGEAAARGDDREAAALAREALARDSTFAWAWNGLGVAHMNLGHRDSAAVAFERALHYPNKMSPEGRWSVEAQLYEVSSDQESRLRVTERYAKAQPHHPASAVNLASALSAMGRNAEAVATAQRALRAGNPLADGLRNNLTGYWVALGEADSAQATAEAITAPEIREPCLLGVAIFRGEGNAIESRAQRILSTPNFDALARDWAHAAFAGRLANRGQVEDAWGRLDEAAVEAGRRGESAMVNLAYWRRALMVLAYGPMPGPVPRSPDRSGSLDSRISAGLEALLDNQPERARSIAKELERRFASKPLMLEGAPSLLRAWAARLEGRPTEVVREASVVLAGAGPESYFSIRKPACRWLIASAFEDLGKPDSAAFHYRAALKHTSLDFGELAAVPLIELPVRQRLVIAEMRAGRPGAARAEREILARRVDRPDAIASRGLAEVDLVLRMSQGEEAGARRTAP